MCDLATMLSHCNLATVMVYTEPTTGDLSARMARTETCRPEDEYVLTGCAVPVVAW